MPFSCPSLSISRKNVADLAMPFITIAAVRQDKGRTWSARRQICTVVYWVPRSVSDVCSAKKCDRFHGPDLG
jgi:hypothetical protein